VEVRMASKDFIDSRGYWIDHARNIRRMSSDGGEGGEQPVIMRATQDCSDAEWTRLYDAIVKCLAAMGPPSSV
jgi:hypothetical protein